MANVSDLFFDSYIANVDPLTESLQTTYFHYLPKKEKQHAMTFYKVDPFTMCTTSEQEIVAHVGENQFKMEADRNIVLARPIEEMLEDLAMAES